MKFLKHKIFYILVFFGIIYSLISLVNHYCFRTYALDLGLYTNAMYDYLHLQWNDNTVFKEYPENLLSDHFDLYLVLFSPFSILFKTYTLLIIQIVFVLLGGYGIYRYFVFRTCSEEKHFFAMAMALAFLLFYGIYSAMSYDYHSNVVAAMLLPYFFLLVRQKLWSKAFFVLFLICIGKENMSLWMCFVITGLMVEYRKEPLVLKYLSVYLIFSAVYFLIITQIIMPALSIEGKFYQFKYSVLGQNYLDAVLQILTHPAEMLKVIFVNHTHHPHANGVKAELHVFVFLSGLWALIFKPQYIIMLIPVYFQKLFHDNYQIWGIDGQYSIEYAPILIIGAGEFFLSVKENKTRRILLGLLILLNLICTVRLMDRTILFTNKSRIRFYQSSHYQRNFNLKDVYYALQLIPDTAVVSAQTSVLPHLALRDKIYTFPMIKDAQYIVLNTNDDTYPMDTVSYQEKVHQILQDTLKWKIIYQRSSVILLKQK